MKLVHDLHICIIQRVNLLIINVKSPKYYYTVIFDRFDDLYHLPTCYCFAFRKSVSMIYASRFFLSGNLEKTYLFFTYRKAPVLHGSFLSIEFPLIGISLSRGEWSNHALVTLLSLLVSIWMDFICSVVEILRKDE